MARSGRKRRRQGVDQAAIELKDEGCVERIDRAVDYAMAYCLVAEPFSRSVHGISTRALDVAKAVSEVCEANAHAGKSGDGKGASVKELTRHLRWAKRTVHKWVEQADEALDDLMWNLLKDYDKDLKPHSPINPNAALADSDPYSEHVQLAVIESVDMIHKCAGTVEITGKRTMPSTLNVNLQLNLSLPQGTSLDLQQSLAQTIQQAQQSLTPAANQAVRCALEDQAPRSGVSMDIRNTVWKKSS